MEDKQLNFNRPILSVRRFSSTVASQEASRRKYEGSLPTVPQIPSYKPEMQSGPLRKPGSVPFVWEQSPGRPKHEAKTQKHAKERPPSVPKLPPGRILKPIKQDLDMITEDSNLKKGPRKESLGSGNVLATKETLTKFESSIETKKERSDSGDDGGGGDIYMDAIDTTPPRLESDNQPGIHSMDPKTQNVMKTIASEVCQPSPMKHMIKEKSRELKKVAHTENKKPQLTYGPNFLQFTAHDDEEDSDIDYDEHENMRFKVCGLLPHFCLKGSIGLLNPVPGLSMRTKLPISPANRTRASSSSASFEPARVAVHEHKSLVEYQKYQDVLKNKPTEVTKQKNFQKLEGSGLYNRLQGRGISNNLTKSSQPPVSERKEVNSQKKGLVSFKELLAEENDWEPDPQNPAVEKTLYVDTIHKVENGQYDFKENDEGIFVTLHTNESKQDKETEIQTGCCKDSQESGLELPAPPPLPKSPSDSWLWRTLPSVSSKNGSLQSNPKYPSSKPAAKLDKRVQLLDSQGLLLPIPET